MEKGTHSASAWMSTQRAVVSIDIYSDMICPWCYVGKRRLERALSKLGSSVPTQVTWRPFQLNPMMPLEGMKRTAYLEEKFGSQDAYHRLEEHVSMAEPQIGFAFDKIAITPNTFAAHRLIGFAAGAGKQDALVEALFSCYFVEGQDIGRIETLKDAAARSGLHVSEVEALLTSDEGVESVKAEEAAGRRLGISAVPSFVVNHTSVLTGAQPFDVLAAAIENA